MKIVSDDKEKGGGGNHAAETSLRVSPNPQSSTGDAQKQEARWVKHGGLRSTGGGEKTIHCSAKGRHGTAKETATKREKKKAVRVAKSWALLRR